MLIPIGVDLASPTRPYQYSAWGSVALVLDPIINGYHLTRVLMDEGNMLSLIYEDTELKMCIDPSRIKPSKTTFKGVIPGVEARC